MEENEAIVQKSAVTVTDTQNQEPFKKPQICLVGPRKSKGSKVRVVDCKADGQRPEEVKIDASETLEASSHGIEDVEKVDRVEKGEETSTVTSPAPEPVKKTSKPPVKAPAQKLKETPVPYLEPKWGGIPTVNYSLDIIKSGTVLEPINLSSKGYIVFGRQTNCDVQMAHPTVSRYHAVLQYSRGTDDKPEGFYLYDLGSTHGTFLNKSRVRPEIFIRIKVGHQIKLGASTRIYLLQGPPDDMEDESELTVTELKAKRQLELQARELAEITRKQKEEEEQRKREEEGIDWGMGDDADEETDLSENPYAVTSNEELYIDDPKKTLRGWFEREGHELEYEVEEKGPGQFLCRVEVPVEGARGGCMVAEALLKGKKKEAVAQCALEACRLLDRLGLLRQATHESRKRKAKNWEEEDFYDSDEDTFLDRTGAVEKKRQQRMHQAGKAESQVETYQSLSDKHTDILGKLESTHSQLRKAEADLAASKAKAADEDGDTLDSFMNNLSTVGCTDKKLISKLKVELAALNKEEARLRKLVNIARPASLPELLVPAAVSKSQQSKDAEALKNKLMLTARRKASEKQKTFTCSSNQDATKISQSLEGKEEDGEGGQDEEKDESENEEKEKDNRKDSDKNKTSVIGNPRLEERIVGPLKPSFPVTPSTSANAGKEEENINSQEEEVATRKNTEELVLKNNCSDDDNDDDKSENSKQSEKRRKRNRRRMLMRNEKALERSKAQYDASDPNYSVWVPPEDQSGDGKTSLNEKLGY